MKKMFPLLLFCISVIVMVGLLYQMNMWKWIVGYWAVLAIKNGFDLRE